MSAEVRRSRFSDHSSSETTLSNRIAQLVARVDYRRSDCAEQQEAIGRLRYQAYLREGAISANPSKIFSDPYDRTENAFLFGLYIDGELASSLRLHIGCRESPDFPSLEVFPDVLRPLLDAGKILVDSTRFVADERLSRLHRGLPYATLRLCMLAAEYFGADHLLAAVRAEHQAFYRRAFNHRVLCEPRSYPQLVKPISLLTLHFPTAAAELYRRYPFFHSSVFERRRLFERFPRRPASAHDSADSPEPTAPQRTAPPLVELSAACGAS